MEKQNHELGVPSLNISMTELLELVNRVKGEIEPNATGQYPLQKTANAIYFKLSTTKGFDSRKLAIFLLANSRNLGLSLEA